MNRLIKRIGWDKGHQYADLFVFLLSLTVGWYWFNFAIGLLIATTGVILGIILYVMVSEAPDEWESQ